MDVDLPSLQFIFRVMQRQGRACEMIQNLSFDLDYEFSNNQPISKEMIEDMCNKLREIAKYLSKFNEELY